MGKRTTKQFERSAADYYVTPREAFAPLIPFLDPATEPLFIEPCAGNGAIVKLAEGLGMECVAAVDVKPKVDGIFQGNSMDFSFKEIVADARRKGKKIQFITNLPWTRKDMLALVSKFILDDEMGGWMLAPAELFYTAQKRAATIGGKEYGRKVMDSAELSKYCDKIVAIGRVCWFPEAEKKKKGKDSCAWYHFQPVKQRFAPEFFTVGVMPSDYKGEIMQTFSPDFSDPIKPIIHCISQHVTGTGKIVTLVGEKQPSPFTDFVKKAMAKIGV